MKIIEQDEFFKAFNETAWTYDEWVSTFDRSGTKENLRKHYTDSSFIERRSDFQLRELKYKQYILAVVANWCGDCHRGAPVLEHISRSNDHLSVKYLKKEDHLDLIPPSDGSQKIPYLMFYSQDGFYIANWVERSYEMYKLTSSVMRKFNYDKNEAFSLSYRNAVEKERNMLYESTSDEIVHIILKVNAIQGSSARINKMLELNKSLET